MKKKITRKTLVPVRLDNEQVKQIDLLCIQRTCYRSEIIREAISEYILKNSKLLFIQGNQIG